MNNNFVKVKNKINFYKKIKSILRADALNFQVF
jgi:hypothetical protein